MRRKKRVYTRRQKALRRIAQAIVCVLVVNYLCMEFFILPRQAVYKKTEKFGMYPVQVVTHFWTKDLNAELAYFTAAKNAVGLTAVKYWPIYGWYADSATVVDCSGDEAFHADWTVRGEQVKEVIFFGRLEDWSICRVELTAERDEKKVMMTVEDFIQEDGKRYFLGRMEWKSKVQMKAFRVTATAYDAAGNVVERQELPY